MRLVRGSKYDALQARYERVLEERDEAEKAAEEHVCQIVRLARENDALRETTQVVPVPQPTQDEQLRAENERLQRDVARLQERLDDVLGLTTTAMDEGARWQQRRADIPRPRPAKEGS